MSTISPDVRGRYYSPAVPEAMWKTWFGQQPERVMNSASALGPVGADEELHKAAWID
jgi:hypothetical protein